MACDSYIFLSVNVGIHTSDSLWALAQVIHTSHFNRVIRWLAHNLPNTPFVFDLDFSTAFQYQSQWVEENILEQLKEEVQEKSE